MPGGRRTFLALGVSDPQLSAFDGIWKRRAKKLASEATWLDPDPLCWGGDPARQWPAVLRDAPVDEEDVAAVWDTIGASESSGAAIPPFLTTDL